MSNLLINWALDHQQYFIGLASGYALAHIPAMVLYAFKLAMKVPWLRAQVVANPKQAKEIVDAIAKELDKDIDNEASASQPPAKS
jgi:predicted NBD/HSP70 family sugar kinase